VTALVAVPAAFATTQRASSGDVTATFTFHGRFPRNYGERLTISRAGKVVYDQPVVAQLCGRRCSPGSAVGNSPSIHVLDLEHNGQPDVVLDLYSDGAHCCTIEQIFSFDPGTMTYLRAEHDFGDPGDRIVDLTHDGRFEFLTADDSFAYEFTDFAASGLPIQILTFSGRRFHDVTRSYPKLIEMDAAIWMKAFKGSSVRHYEDTVGVVAAWAADEDLLGHSKLVSRFLARQLKAGHLKSALSPVEPGGKRFVTKLQRFLRRHGYLR
jgi:hypothetical protein